MSRLKFKISGVSGIKLSGIVVDGKKSADDFHPMDALKLFQGFSNKKMPLQFTLNIAVENPNNGKGGYPRTDIYLKSFPWKLYIDDKEMLFGNIASPIYIPGVGEATVFPINIDIDLLQFFGLKTYKELLSLALRMAGAPGKPVEVRLTARPVVSTPLGDISYPDEITIVSKEFK